jgi:hypothetical protein
MDVPVAVFLVFAALYFGGVVGSASPAWLEWTAPATTITGAFATFSVMLAREFALLPAIGVLGCLAVVTTLATLACVQADQPSRAPATVHALVLSTGLLSGTAAYVAYVAAAAAGVPLWAALALTVACAPMFATHVMPAVAQNLEPLFWRDGD